jgi:hypothetical protein
VNRAELAIEVMGWTMAVLLVVFIYISAIFAYSITESLLDSQKGDSGKLPEPDSQ